MRTRLAVLALGAVLLAGVVLLLRPLLTSATAADDAGARAAGQAYDRLLDGGPVVIDAQLLLMNGISAYNSAKGTGQVVPAQRRGEQSLVFENGVTIRVRRSGSLLQQSASRGSEAAHDLPSVDLRSTSPASLPELVSPGLDPLQVMVLLRALREPGAVRGTRPVHVVTAEGAADYLDVSTDVRRLAASADPDDRRWLEQLAGALGRQEITLRLLLDGGNLRLVSVDLPTLPAASSSSRGPVDGAEAHTVVNLRFSVPDPS